MYHTLPARSGCRHRVLARPPFGQRQPVGEILLGSVQVTLRERNFAQRRKQIRLQSQRPRLLRQTEAEVRVLEADSLKTLPGDDAQG